MIRRLLCAAVCALATHGAVAATPGYTLSKDKRVVAFGPPTASSPPPSHGGYAVIFDNLADRDPKGLYMASLGFAFGGANSPIGSSAFAAAFTPQRSATVQMVQVAAGLISGKNQLLASIYADASGAPGAVLWQGTASMPRSGNCCATATLAGVGPHLDAGTVYWLGLAAAAGGDDTFGAWSFNVADQVDPGQTAVDDGAGWMVSPSKPTVAFGLYGQ